MWWLPQREDEKCRMEGVEWRSWMSGCGNGLWGMGVLEMEVTSMISRRVGSFFRGGFFGIMIPRAVLRLVGKYRSYCSQLECVEIPWWKPTVVAYCFVESSKPEVIVSKIFIDPWASSQRSPFRPWPIGLFSPRSARTRGGRRSRWTETLRSPFGRNRVPCWFSSRRLG